MRFRIAVIAAVVACAPIVACTTASSEPVGPIADVTYQQTRGPLGPGTDNQTRAQSDPAQIDALADILNRYPDTPTDKPEPRRMCIWTTITTVTFTRDGSRTELIADACDPTPFEAELGALVANWAKAS